MLKILLSLLITLYLFAGGTSENSFCSFDDSEGIYGSTDSGGETLRASFLFRMSYDEDRTAEELFESMNLLLGEAVVSTLFSQCSDDGNRRRRLFEMYDGWIIHPIELEIVANALAGMDVTPNYILVDGCFGTDSCGIYKGGLTLYKKGTTQSGNRRERLRGLDVVATNDTVISIILSIIKESLDNVVQNVQEISELEWISATRGEFNGMYDEGRAEDLEDELSAKNDNDIIVGSNLTEETKRDFDAFLKYGVSALLLVSVALTAVVFRNRLKDKKAESTRISSASSVDELVSPLHSNSSGGDGGSGHDMSTITLDNLSPPHSEKKDPFHKDVDVSDDSIEILYENGPSSDDY
jgi:hypothetical protein